MADPVFVPAAALALVSSAGEVAAALDAVDWDTFLFPVALRAEVDRAADVGSVLAVCIVLAAARFVAAGVPAALGAVRFPAVVGLPVLAAPVFAVPVFAVPAFAVPVFAVPVFARSALVAFAVPAFAALAFTVPVFALPVFALPTVALPVFALPVFAVPVFAVPAFAVPAFAVPAFAAVAVTGIPAVLDARLALAFSALGACADRVRPVALLAAVATAARAAEATRWATPRGEVASDDTRDASPDEADALGFDAREDGVGGLRCGAAFFAAMTAHPLDVPAERTQVRQRIGAP